MRDRLRDALHEAPRIAKIHDEREAGELRDAATRIVHHVRRPAADDRAMYAGLHELQRERGGAVRPRIAAIEVEHCVVGAQEVAAGARIPAHLMTAERHGARMMMVVRAVVARPRAQTTDEGATPPPHDVLHAVDPQLDGGNPVYPH